MSSSIDIGTIRRHTNTPKKVKALADNAAIRQAIRDQIEDTDFRRLNKLSHDRIKVHDEGLKFGKLHDIGEVYECPFEPDMSSLMLWHRLSAPGRRSIDVSGFKHSGYFEGTPRVVRGPDTGVEGGASLALFFDGKYDFVRIPHQSKLGLHKIVTGFTQFMRVSPCSQDSDNGSMRRILCKRDPPISSNTSQGTPQYGYVLAHDENRLVFLVLWQGLRYSTEILNPFPTLCLTREEGWYQIVTTFDAITKQVKIYLNNSAIENVSPATDVNAIAIPSEDFDIHIARNASPLPINEGRYHGGIADFRMYYDLIASESQVNNLWVNKQTITPTPYGTVGLAGHSYAIKEPPAGFRGGYSVTGFTSTGYAILKKRVKREIIAYYNIVNNPTVKRTVTAFYAIMPPNKVRNGITGVYDLLPPAVQVRATVQGVYTLIPPATPDDPNGGGGGPLQPVYPPGVPTPGGIDEFGIGKINKTTTDPVFGLGQGEYFSRSWGKNLVYNFNPQGRPTLLDNDDLQVWADGGAGATVRIDGQGHAIVTNDTPSNNTNLLTLSIFDWFNHFLKHQNDPSSAADSGYEGSRWGPNVEITWYMTWNKHANSVSLFPDQFLLVGMGGDRWYTKDCPYNSHEYRFGIQALGQLFITRSPYFGMQSGTRPQTGMELEDAAFNDPWWIFPAIGGDSGGGGVGAGGNTDPNGVKMLYANTGNFNTDSWTEDSNRPEWQTSDVPLNFEMTGYFRSSSGDDVSAKIRGGRHTDNNNMLGCCYILHAPTGGGEPRMRTECPHPNGYVECDGINIHNDALGCDDEWRGYKAIAVNRGNSVHMELWEDQGDSSNSPANQWVLLFEVDDSDGFCCDDCSPFPLLDYSNAEGTEQVSWRIDVDGTESKWLSIVELGTGTGDGGGGGPVTGTFPTGPDAEFFPMSQRIGFKIVKRLVNNGNNVMIEVYRDMTDGQSGGSWAPLMQFKHVEGNWEDLIFNGDPNIMEDLFNESEDNSDRCVFTPQSKDETHNMDSNSEIRFTFGQVGQMTIEKVSIREIDPLP